MICLECQNHVDECTCGDNGYLDQGDFLSLLQDFIKIGRAGDRGLVYEGIHQKMIVIDRARAYIGSGEIRAPSFIVNGDVGVIQSGQAAQFWADYFMLFWSEALQVDHQFFRSAQS